MPEHPEITTVRVFRASDGDVWWTALAANGEPISRSSEGYRRHIDARDAAVSLFPDAELVDEVTTTGE